MVEPRELFDKVCIHFTLPISKSPRYVSINIENIYDIDFRLDSLKFIQKSDSLTNRDRKWVRKRTPARKQSTFQQFKQYDTKIMNQTTNINFDDFEYLSR